MKVVGRMCFGFRGKVGIKREGITAKANSRAVIAFDYSGMRTVSIT